MLPPSNLSLAESLTSAQRQIFYERHRSLAMLMILVVLLFPFAGLYVTGLFGAVLGLRGPQTRTDDADPPVAGRTHT